MKPHAWPGQPARLLGGLHDVVGVHDIEVEGGGRGAVVLLVSFALARKIQLPGGTPRW